MIPANQLVGRPTHLEEHDDRKQNAAAEQAVAEVDLRGEKEANHEEYVVAIHSHVHQHLEVNALPNADNGGEKRTDEAWPVESTYHESPLP